jgi:hypothetical protein
MDNIVVSRDRCCRVLTLLAAFKWDMICIPEIAKRNPLQSQPLRIQVDTVGPGVAQLPAILTWLDLDTLTYEGTEDGHGRRLTEMQ